MLFARLKEERIRLKSSQEGFSSICGVSKRTYMRWEKEVSIPADKLSLLISEGLDSQFVITGVRSNNLEKITNKPETPHFDFEGKLSTIVKVLEEVLNDLDLSLNPKDKGEVVETLLMQAMLKHSIPTKDDIYPILKLVA